MIVEDCKRWLTSLAVTWIDYCKPYDMVPHSWIQKRMEMFGVAVNVTLLLTHHWSSGTQNWLQLQVHRLEKYLSTSKKKILKEVSCIRIIENNKCGKSKEVRKEHQEKYEGKPRHRQFRKATKEVRSKRSWDWLKKGYLKKETESTIVALQDQALCTRNLRNAVYGENVESICRVCGAADETVAHIVSECSKLV